MTIDTVVIPVAGNGTRMLPASKSVPKELLPVYDTPVLQFALDEAVATGAKRIVLVSHRSKSAIEDYIRPSAELEGTLREKGKVNLLQKLERGRIPDDVEVCFAYQDEPLGLGHAVLCAQDYVLPGAFGVILPDDVVMGSEFLGSMVDNFDATRMQSLIGSLKVPPEEASSYGIFDFEGEVDVTRPSKARGMVEKPDVGTAPSQFAAIGRYILSSQIFDVLAVGKRGAGGEIQLTDAIAACGDIYALPVDAPRFDCGCHEGLHCAAEFVRALRREEMSLQIAAE